MKADNVLTWDMALMVEAQLAGMEIDSTWVFRADIHEREFKTSTTYSFHV